MFSCQLSVVMSTFNKLVYFEFDDILYLFCECFIGRRSCTQPRPNHTRIQTNVSERCDAIFNMM